MTAVLKSNFNPVTDKAVTLSAPVGDLLAGDLLIMRDKPAHPVPLTFPYVLAQASNTGPVLLMVYDRQHIEREGLTVVAFAVGLMRYGKPMGTID
ncbi:hypothetical protein EIP75_16110 [Aquabacterium soli]|uniref:Uncharacterized protein n=1 Tax=Aquabacterium soli TaxID=2493092 RepID=A0A426V8H1_9BURK|nr:hypothetical protein [Aquabacterium soli]RRS03215.1 hypothetical protein EIP75_16110 [Aquabacterium soli]